MWRRTLGASVAALALLAAGCSGDDGGGSGDGDGSLTFWTVYDTNDRMAKMKPVLADFTDRNTGGPGPTRELGTLQQRRRGDERGEEHHRRHCERLLHPG